MNKQNVKKKIKQHKSRIIDLGNYSPNAPRDKIKSEIIDKTNEIQLLNDTID